MIWFAIGFVLMVILSICSYWMGYSRYKKYDKEKNDTDYNSTKLFFRMFFVFFIIGIIILFAGYLVRVICFNKT